jgi:hydroxyethylthiazole kinase-like uncharacterized protein yjeF
VRLASRLRTDPRHGVIDSAGCVVVATGGVARAIDAHAIATAAMPSRLLMELAGARAAAALLERLGGAAAGPGRVVVLCGGGNNGGDGYVVARHLHEAGWHATVIAAAPPATADAAANAALFEALGSPDASLVRAEALDSAGLEALAQGPWNLVVDALLGTGLRRAPSGELARCLEAFGATRGGRQHNRPLHVALDVPSGLDADLGAAFAPAFRADLTLTFGVLKAGLLLRDGPELAGEVQGVPIGWPMASVAAFTTPESGTLQGWGSDAHAAPGASSVTRRPLRRPLPAWLVGELPARLPDGHKGRYGHVAVVGGLDGTEGAALLACRGALRAGAGLCTRVGGLGALDFPEVMTWRPTAESPLPPRATVLVVGPGLGRSAEAASLLAACAADPRPRVLDADALTPEALVALAPRGVQAVLTPHPREAARLLETTVEAVVADRVSAAEAIARRYGVVALVKGRNPVVAGRDGGPTFILDVTAPALSAGGTGDVLAGVIGALMAQGVSPLEAAVLGAELHGRAGVVAGLEAGDRGVLASEIADRIPGVIASLLAGWAV